VYRHVFFPETMEIRGTSGVSAAQRETRSNVDLEAKPLANDNQLRLSGVELTENWNAQQ
jgi:hypothetical protein